MVNILIVGLGGALGAICRYGISQLPISSIYPVATFVTNLIGAFIIGFVVGISEKKKVSDEIIIFIKTGFCGGFTTFSTFSLESMTLLKNGNYFVGSVYIILSILLCIIGVVLGKVCAYKICS